MKQKMKKIYIGCILLVMILLLGGAAWLIFGKREATTDVKNAKNKLGVEWYDQNGKEFTITTVEEFYEFAELSEYYDFAGQTIKLGADIVVNEGNAADWAKEMPKYTWESIYGFAGTFDGQGHTISGLYSIGYLYTSNPFSRLLSTDYVTAGLFRSTHKNCVIKNFKLLNSYFVSDLNYGVGSVSSNGGGTFDSIYSDAIIVSQKYYNGGIIGKASEDTTITNCWYDGKLEVTGGYGTHTGGLIGRAEEGTKCKIEHCLVSGDLKSDLYKKGVNLGGFVGNTTKSTVEISDSFVSGKLYNDWKVVGSAIGQVPKGSTFSGKDVFVTSDTFSTIIGYVGGEVTGMPVAFDRETLTGYGGYQWTTLDFENYWAAVEGGTPILKTFATDSLSLDGIAKMVDISWYNEDEDTFILMDVADLNGFAVLSYSKNFEGKTVKLGADITVNDGKAKDWVKTPPSYKWLSIGSTALPFAGTFDGQMHTISGVYLSTDESYKGLFGVTANSAVIKNFSLKNSYFESSAASFGSIAGRGVGTFDTIYSNAIVVSSSSNAGGIIGQVNGSEDVSLKMNNCWFDGSVTNTGNTTASRRSGGLIGFTLKKTTISNCLNTGTIDATAYKCTNSATSKTVQPFVGGLVGYVYKDATLNVSYSMNVGKVKYSDAVTSGFGSIIGLAGGKTELSHVYATTESCKITGVGNVEGQAVVYDEKQLSGYGGYQWTTLNFDKYWAVVLDDTSILRSFAKKVPSLNGVARMVDTSWYNKKADTYVLNDAADLYGFALLSKTENFAGKTVKLGADITINTGNASEWGVAAPEYEWVSIGSSSKPFAGTFDGQMHTISGVYLDTDQAYSGLFASTTDKAAVKNLSLENSYFESSAASLGSIVGRGVGTFDTIYSNAIVVSSNSNAGGVVGQANGGEGITMNNCWFDGSVTNTSNTTAGRRSGGLIGFTLVNTDIANCLNSGTIDVTAYTCTNNETSKTVQPFAGGLVGYTYKLASTNVSNSMNVGQVKYSNATTSGYGSIIGYAAGNTEITNTYATSESCKVTATGEVKGQAIVYDKEKLSGYGGYQWTTLDFDKYWAVVSDDTSILRSFATEVPSLSGVSKLFDTSWYDESKDKYTLKDAKDLFGFAMLSNSTDFAGKTVKLGEDIVVPSEYEWESIGSTALPFAGTFDGKMHTISGLQMKTDASYEGMFGMTGKDAVIKNFKLTDSYFESTAASFGSIAGRGLGTFDTIYSSATVVSSGSNVGGLVGQVTGGNGIVMNNCWFDGTVTNTGNSTSSRRTAGLVGFILTDSSITNCLNTGVIDASAYTYISNAQTGAVQPYVGGLVGCVANDSKLKLSDSLNTGEVKYSTAVTSTLSSTVAWAIGGSVEVSNTYARKESCVKNHKIVGTDVTGTVTQVSDANITGYTSYNNAIELDYCTYRNPDGVWVVREDDVPGLKSFVDQWIDVEWYYEPIHSEGYVIRTAEGLYGFSAIAQNRKSFSGYTIKLGADIDLNKGEGDAKEWGTKPPAREWTTIGNNNANFQGTFDGQGYTIRGMYLKANSIQQGMFGRTTYTSVIQNFRLENSYFEVTDAYAVGSIVGYSRGIVRSVYSDAYVVANIVNTTYDYVQAGGIVGCANGSRTTTVSDCWFNGHVILTGTAREGGGIIGRVEQGAVNISNCLFTGEISSERSATQRDVRVGGIMAIQNGTSTIRITNCLSDGKLIVNDYQNVGSIVGRLKYSSPKSTYIMSGVYATEECNTDASGTVRATYNYGTGDEPYGEAEVIARDDVKNTDAFTLTGLDFTDYWVAKNDSAPRLKTFETADCKPDGMQAYTGWYNPKDTEFIINTPRELYGLAKLVVDNTFVGQTVKLGADIALNGTNRDEWKNEWTPIGHYSNNTIGDFKGTFDGQGHIISGLYMEGGTRTGLFASVKDGVVKNLRIANSEFAGTVYANGVIANYFSGEMQQVYCAEDVDIRINRGSSLEVMTGGLVGLVVGDAAFNECWFAGNISVVGYSTGGIFGGTKTANIDMTIKNCLVTGEVVTEIPSNKYSHIGGFAGRINASGATLAIKNSLFAGEIKHNSDASMKRAALLVGLLQGGAGLTVESTYANEDALAEHTNESSTAYNDMVGNSTTSVQGSVIMSDILSDDGITGENGFKLIGLDFTNYWVAKSDSTPELKAFSEADYTPSKIQTYTGWYEPYNSTKTTYTLTTVNELYGLSKLSTEGHNFTGKKIILGADIVINDEATYGDAETWGNADYAKADELYKWTPIKEFAGTFDGKDYSISGIYIHETAATKNGFFSVLADGSEVCNLRIENSYIYSSKDYLGSLAGEAVGSVIRNVYSEAIIKSDYRSVGGFVGLIKQNSTKSVGESDCTFSNCWYNGKLSLTNASSGWMAGGIVGNIGDFACNPNIKITLTDCHNSADISCERSGGANVIGGLLGHVGCGAIDISNCLNTGELRPKNTEGVGSIAGNFRASLSVEDVNISNTYGINAQYPQLIDGVGKRTSDSNDCMGLRDQENLGVILVGTEQNLYGDSASGLFDSTKTTAWKAVTGGVPVLKSFADYVVAGMKLIDNDIVNMSIVYTNSEYATIAANLEVALETATGKDFVVEDSLNGATVENSIVVGKIYTEECSALYKDMSVDTSAVVSKGSNIYLCGLNATKLQEACDKLTSKLQVETINEKKYAIVKEDAFDDAIAGTVTYKLFGNSLASYSIVVPEDVSKLYMLMAEYFQDKVFEETQIRLDIVTDNLPSSGYDIVFGDTARSASDAVYNDNGYIKSDYGYSIVRQDNSLAVGYTDATALISAYDELFALYKKADTTDFERADGTDDSVNKVAKADASHIRVMSSNIYTQNGRDFDTYLQNTYGVTTPAWEARAEILAEVYMTYKPDFFGLQEASFAQQDEILKYVGELYARVEFDNLVKNQTPIFYRKDLYKIEAKEYHDFGSGRHYEWALYSSLENPDEQFIHMNLHYHPIVSEQAPGAKTVNAVIKRLMTDYPGVPIAVTGDYNNNAISETYKTMVDGIHMDSGAALVGKKDPTNLDCTYYTWHTLSVAEPVAVHEKYPNMPGPIDIVSITTDLLEAMDYKAIYNPLICWGSDHYPVFLDVKVK